MNNNKLEIVRVRSVKLNQDRKTAKIKIEGLYDGKHCKITIPKLDISSLQLEINTSYEQVSENPILPHKTIMNTMAHMLVDTDDTGSAFSIKLNE